jgi:hypothetical protein
MDNIDGFVKSPVLLFFVIPAKVRRGGLFQIFSATADFHGSDGIFDFLRSRQLFSL